MDLLMLTELALDRGCVIQRFNDAWYLYDPDDEVADASLVPDWIIDHLLSIAKDDDERLHPILVA